MLKHYIKTGLKNLIQNKTYTAINIVGLSIGLTCSVLIVLWIKDELSFDRFHENQNEIYRIIGNRGIFTPKPLASILIEDIPEIDDAVRFMQMSSDVKFEYNKNLQVENPVFVGDSFFEIFSFPFIKGNPDELFQKPSSIVISQDMAQRMFGDKDAVGQNITMHFFGNEIGLTITGIFKDMPSNSHIETDCFLSISDFWKRLINDNFQEWSDWGVSTYIQAQKGVNPEEIKRKINASIIKHTNENYEYRVQQLQPLKDIHLYSSFEDDYAKSSEIKYIYIFSFVALIIALIACINYININTSIAIRRLKEIGIRKAVGAKRISLIQQFSAESIIVVLFASLFAIVFMESTNPYFNQLTGKSLNYGLSNLSIAFLIVGCIFFLGTILGLLSAFSFSSIKVTAIIKSKINGHRNKFLRRNILIIIQLSLSISIIIGAFVIKKQLIFLDGMNLGFEKEQLVYFNILNNSVDNIELIKKELLKHPNILNITSGHVLTPSNMQSTSSIDWPDKSIDEILYAYIHRVDYNFQNTYKTQMKEGRFFSKKFGTDKTAAYILNESAVKNFNIKSPIGKSFTLWGFKGNIIGVISDYHFKSAHKQVPSVVMWMNTTMNFGGFESITIRVNPKNVKQTITDAQRIIQKYNNGYLPEYQFVDSSFVSQYKSEKRLSTLLNIATALALLISCLGLIGSIMHSSKQRIKEIGIRKTNGAKTREIMILLTKDFTKWVVIAFVIACPIAWYFMNKWLQNFAYRTSLNWWIFAAAGVIALLVVLLTVSWQSWRAASRNPVESLRYE